MTQEDIGEQALGTEIQLNYSMDPLGFMAMLQVRDFETNILKLNLTSLHLFSLFFLKYGQILLSYH